MISCANACCFQTIWYIVIIFNYTDSMFFFRLCLFWPTRTMDCYEVRWVQHFIPAICYMSRTFMSTVPQVWHITVLKLVWIRSNLPKIRIFSLRWFESFAGPHEYKFGIAFIKDSDSDCNVWPVPAKAGSALFHIGSWAGPIAGKTPSLHSNKIEYFIYN